MRATPTDEESPVVMHGMFRARSLLLTTILSVALPAWAQTEPETDSEASGDEQAPKKKGKKKKKKKKGTEVDGATQEKRTEKPATQKITPPASPKEPSSLFPPWRRSDFDWFVKPIFAFKYATNTSSGLTTRTTTAETGVKAGLTEIPIVPGNPGLGAGIHAGFAFGDAATVVTQDQLDVKEKSDVRYRRTLGGVTFTGYYDFVRQQLGFEKSRLEYQDEAKTIVQQISVDHDLGLLILSWLSAHHTLGYQRAFYDQSSEPFLISQDHWLHARISTDFLSFRFDLGPGLTFAEEYAKSKADKNEKVAEGRTDYFLFLTQMKIIWKLGAAGSAKYIYNSSEKKLGTLAGVRLPGDDLDQPSSVAQPEDSFVGSFFLGLSDIYHGIGVGWRYNVEILNLNERDDKKKSVTRDSGFGLSVQAEI